MIALEWNEWENPHLPVYEARCNGIRLASICFTGGGEKPWEVRVYLPGHFIPWVNVHHAQVADAKKCAQYAVDEWFARIGVQS